MVPGCFVPYFCFIQCCQPSIISRHRMIADIILRKSILLDELSFAMFLSLVHQIGLVGCWGVEGEYYWIAAVIAIAVTVVLTITIVIALALALTLALTLTLILALTVAVTLCRYRCYMDCYELFAINYMDGRCYMGYTKNEIHEIHEI